MGPPPEVWPTFTMTAKNITLQPVNGQDSLAFGMFTSYRLITVSREFSRSNSVAHSTTGISTKTFSRTHQLVI
ncbi:MAG: hypothetical protein R2942_02525 [Ignavibacteria bacterium]